MQIGVLGMNHKSADLALRELFARTCQRRFGAEHSAHAGFSYVLLSTCNRTEIYFSGEDLACIHTYLLGVLRGDLCDEFEHRLYSYFGSECFCHLASVTSGMDSALVGETEIQGQVKNAYEIAAAFQRLSSELHFLFQKCLKIGKQVRSTLPLGMPTIEDAIINAGCFLFGELTERKILFVGVSEINQRIFAKFQRKQIGKITLCNRSNERARALASHASAQVLAWEELCRWSEYDLVIFGTKAPRFLLVKEAVASELASRKLVIDLSVPRNVDPRLARHPQITLLNVDQLSRRQRLKRAEVARIEEGLLAPAALRQVALYRARESARVEGLLSRVG